jgi:uncharacterized membrane protein
MNLYRQKGKHMSASQTISAPAQWTTWLRWLGVVFAILGLGVAVYMSYAELTGQETSCPGATSEVEAGEVAVDCGFVQNSIYAKVAGIPVAILGFFGYLGILAVWLLEDRVPFLGEYGHLLVFGMAFFGFLFSTYLTYTELFIMYTVCTWCLLSALFMTLVAIVATVRLVLSMRS